MDTQQILDMLLSSGQELANKGKTIAEEKLNIPDNPEDRKAMLDSAGKGALTQVCWPYYWALGLDVN